MTTPVRVVAGPGGRAVPRGAAPPARTARPVPAPVMARTTAAFDMPALMQTSTVPRTLGDEAGTPGGAVAGPSRPAPSAVYEETIGGHNGSRSADVTGGFAPPKIVVAGDPGRTTR